MLAVAQGARRLAALRLFCCCCVPTAIVHAIAVIAFASNSGRRLRLLSSVSPVAAAVGSSGALEAAGGALRSDFASFIRAIVAFVVSSLTVLFLASGGLLRFAAVGVRASSSWGSGAGAGMARRAATSSDTVRVDDVLFLVAMNTIAEAVTILWRLLLVAAVHVSVVVVTPSAPAARSLSPAAPRSAVAITIILVIVIVIIAIGAVSDRGPFVAEAAAVATHASRRVGRRARGGIDTITSSFAAAVPLCFDTSSRVAGDHRQPAAKGEQQQLLFAAGGDHLSGRRLVG